MKFLSFFDMEMRFAVTIAVRRLRTILRVDDMLIAV